MKVWVDGKGWRREGPARTFERLGFSVHWDIIQGAPELPEESRTPYKDDE